MMALFSLFLMMATKPQASRFKAMDSVIQQAIQEKRIPGAVLVVGHNGHVTYRKAFGNRAIYPKPEPMTLDTIFDCASLTKVVATTTCVMQLHAQGKFRLNDKITDYIPEFMGGHSDITIRLLLTHFSGLEPDVPLEPHWTGYDTGLHLACTFPPASEPGAKHVYSDINFILLGELVHRLSGLPLDEYANARVFQPLGLRDTCFNPRRELIPRIAPTESLKPGEPPLRGVVHDPTTRNMGGVAGHAGMFSTADDLAKFCQMILNEGSLNGHQILTPLSIRKATEPQTPLNQPVLRGLGWDIDSPYSSNRGELFPIGSFGHTGFTGTSLWIDPFSKTYVILLTNAIHLGGPPIVAIRSKIATIAAAEFGIKSPRIALTGYNERTLLPVNPVTRNARTKTGLDVLEGQGFKPLVGKRVGLITNQTGLDREGRRNIDVMLKSGVHLVTLFSPEHGFAGKVDHPGVTDTVDEATGLKVYSLYGDHLKPTPEMLKDLDVLVFDIQDAGVRFYTYESTMAYALEAAAEAKLPFMVLDRPNPIGGLRVEGPPIDPNHVSFVGCFPGMPVRHGMTMGELAQMLNAEKKLGAQLTVTKLEDWQRGDWYDSTNLPWTNPSPNMRSLKAESLYPGLCLVEYSPNLSVGRGTDAPFEQIGADFIDARQLADYLNRRAIPGVRVYPTAFTPTESKLAGTLLHGVRFEITDRHNLNSVRVGLDLACALEHLYPGKVDWDKAIRLIGSEDVIRRIKAGESALIIEESYREQLLDFVKVRGRYLLY